MKKDITIGYEEGDEEVIRVRFCDKSRDYPVVIIEHLFISESGKEFRQCQIAVPTAVVDKVRTALSRAAEEGMRTLTPDEFIRRHTYGWSS